MSDFSQSSGELCRVIFTLVKIDSFFSLTAMFVPPNFPHKIVMRRLISLILTKVKIGGQEFSHFCCIIR